VFSSATATDANGSASVLFSMPDTSYKGIVHITATVKQAPAIKSSVDIIIH
jgi:hypothetical protein